MRRGRFLTACAASVLALTGCTPAAPSTPTPPAAIDVARSIAYGEAAGDELNLDACVPGERSGGPFPAVVLIHGGAFQDGDRSSMLPLCEYFAGEGIAAFSIDYRLLPASYPSQVEDAGTAVRWLREPDQTDRFDIDPDRISLLGSSAGGIIALSAADRLGAEGEGVASIVALSAAGDLTSAGRSLGVPDPALESVVSAYVGCPDMDSCPAARDASPLYNVAGLPPTLLVHGTDELIPLAQATALEAAITAGGHPVELVVVDGGRHGLRLLDGETRSRITAFVDDHSSP